MPFDRFSEQSILSKGNGDFNFYVKQDKYFLTLNGETQQVATVSGTYDHIAITLDGATDNVQVYLNGIDSGTYTYSSVSGDWSTQSWVVGAADDMSPSNFYTGLVDELAIFDTLLTQSQIQIHAGLGTNGGVNSCLLYTSPSPRDRQKSRMPSSA